MHRHLYRRRCKWSKNYKMQILFCLHKIAFQPMQWMNKHIKKDKKNCVLKNFIQISVSLYLKAKRITFADWGTVLASKIGCQWVKYKCRYWKTECWGDSTCMYTQCILVKDYHSPQEEKVYCMSDSNLMSCKMWSNFLVCGSVQFVPIQMLLQ